MRNIHNHKEDSVSPNFAQFRIFEPHIGHQKCYTVVWNYDNTVPQVH